MAPRRLEQELNEAAKAMTARTTVENKKAQSQRTSDNGEDSGMINDQLSLILRVVRGQAEQQNKQLERHEKLIEQYGNVLQQQWTVISQPGTLFEKHIRETKMELAAIREEHGKFAKALADRLDAFERRLDAADARFEAFAKTTNERLEALSKLFSQINANVTAATSYADAVKSGLSATGTGVTSQGSPITQICSINPSSSASQQDTTS